MTATPKAIVVGGGMITRIQLLPTIYQLQREGVLGEIHICALDGGPLREIQEDATLQRAFPGQDFVPHPDPVTVDRAEKFPEAYKEAFAEAGEGNLAVIAVPDHLHYGVLKEAVKSGLHVCVVKPLVLKHAQAEEIAKLAYERGVVGC